MLENLEIIKVDQDLTNIISNEIGKELYIENEFHKAKGFRKLHIEAAEFSKNLKILHCVFLLFQPPSLIYHQHLKIKILNTKKLFLKLIKVLLIH